MKDKQNTRVRCGDGKEEKEEEEEEQQQEEEQEEEEGGGGEEEEGVKVNRINLTRLTYFLPLPFVPVSQTVCYAPYCYYFLDNMDCSYSTA